MRYVKIDRISVNSMRDGRDDRNSIQEGDEFKKRKYQKLYIKIPLHIIQNFPVDAVANDSSIKNNSLWYRGLC